jgi:DNA replication protein DnaC
MIPETLTSQLNRLKLKGLLETLEVRLQQAEANHLTAAEFLQLSLQDEITRREAASLKRRLQSASFESKYTFENMLFDHYPSKVQRHIRDLQAGGYLHEGKSIIIMGPTGTGKTHLAHALGHIACCRGLSTRFIRTQAMLRELQASRADLSWSKVFAKYLKPKLLILDDFALKSMSAEQAEDIYELIAERIHKGNFIITSNRTVDAWVKLFPDPVMANAALDRLANNAHQIILEGDSFRKRGRPKQET